ncbi:hypothetical protein [Actinacidiphila bryophytorum]|uniref:Flagellar hook-associated protein flgK n=1 Tax=Actinacidiphila bryophytorum TaxID=1436133 RepID=A0A9W4GXC2_9ACTN|nr:hypothetical protein [Actinacidiphila bryophytorum]MBM9435317.1 hypothetical protein [Actinacidiphila bryophytorum]MBN6542195.1 hypothetical protein [Actinacidiphila bryophytorum]CAG7606753.1 Flagellar hook-associated protein flgK [Actinacidiphila bryophytorum]
MRTLPAAQRTARIARWAGTAAALTALATACTHAASATATAPNGISAAPGQVTVEEPGVSLSITGAVAHLDPSGSGTLSMTVHNGSSVPEHLDMVATPDGGRGVLTGRAGAPASGSMTSAGILLEPDSTVTFGKSGPSVRLTHLHGVANAHTLALMLQFGVTGLVHLSAVIPAR